MTGKIKDRIFLIKDIDCEVVVEITTRKDILEWLSDYVENVCYDWCDGSDEAFAILYKDGTTDYIDENYDGHKIKKINIAAIVYTNACTDMIYGNFEINEFGVCTPSFEMVIDNTNIIEVDSKRYR